MRNFRKHAGAMYYCYYCIQGFTRQDLLDQHMETCSTFGNQRVSLPKPGTTLKFQNIKKQMKKPFVIYCDFESVLRPVTGVTPDPMSSFTESTQIHEPCGFCIYTVCIDPRWNKLTLYRGESA